MADFCLHCSSSSLNSRHSSSSPGVIKVLRVFIHETYLLSSDQCGFADSALAIVGLKSRWGWRQEGSSLVRICWTWLGSAAQHSQLNHQHVAAGLLYLEAVWHIKSGRQGVSQQGRPPWLHNNDLRRCWDGKFLMQTSMNLSTGGFGAFGLWEWSLLRMVNSEKLLVWDAAADGTFHRSVTGEEDFWFTCSLRQKLLCHV